MENPMTDHRYYIMKDANLILVVYKGVLTFDNFNVLNEKILEDQNYNPLYKVLIDVRLTIMKLSHNEMKKVFKLIDDNTSTNSNNNVAILTLTPDQTAKSFLILTLTIPRHIHGMVFTTLNASLKYLGIDINSRLEIVKKIEEITQEEFNDLDIKFDCINDKISASKPNK